MHIVHVVGTFYPHHGGMGEVVHAEVEELVKRGHTVRVVTMQYPGDSLQETKDGFSIVRLKPLVRLGDGGVVNFNTIFAAADVVHLHYPWYGSFAGAARACRAAGKPYVVTMHMVGQVHGLKSLLKKVYDVFCLRGPFQTAAKIFLVSKDYFLKSKLSFIVTTAEELPNPVPDAFFDAHEHDKNVFGLDIPATAAVLLFVGNLLPIKKLDLLIEAIQAGNPTWHLVVVGGGYAEKEYREQALALGLQNRVHFIGPLPRQELPRLYAAADCVVVPSSSESFSLVAAEAMACRVPVIVSSAPGAGRLAQSGAFGFESGSVESLVAAIKSVVVLPAEQKTWAVQQAYAYAKNNFTIGSHVNRLEEWYNKLVV